MLLFYCCLFSLLQIELLEMEKSSSQRNLDTIVGLATEQNICAREKYEEVIIVWVVYA